MRIAKILLALAVLAVVIADSGRGGNKNGQDDDDEDRCPQRLPTLIERKIEYKVKGVSFEGILIYENVPGSRPGVLVAHQFLGISSLEIENARRLARKGFAAFVTDVYGKGVRYSSLNSTQIFEAFTLLQTILGNRAAIRERITAALRTLQNQQVVNPSKIAAIGFCFGGTTILELARTGTADVAAYSSYHGNVSPTLKGQGALKGKILIAHGGDDPIVPRSELKDFEDEAKNSTVAVDYQIVIFSNTLHSFTDPGVPVLLANAPTFVGIAAYSESAARRSFAYSDILHKEAFGNDIK